MWHGPFLVHLVFANEKAWEPEVQLKSQFSRKAIPYLLAEPKQSFSTKLKQSAREQKLAMHGQPSEGCHDLGDEETETQFLWYVDEEPTR